MTVKEVNRVEVFLKIKNKQLKQTQAAKELNLSLRQIQRLYREFKKKGIQALVSKKRGKQSNHQLPSSIKCRVEELITCERYVGFGPLFMSETLEKYHLIKISKETTRKLMIENGVWEAKNKKRLVVYQQRQQRARKGELLQIDGSPHDWFENRGDRCTLIVFIDDATRQIYAKFFESETTHAYMETALEYFGKYGKPLAFYSDKHGIFRINQPSCSNEQYTQFGRAAKELGIQLICASSPQAKGRVERVNETLQDRLVKELRLRNINTIGEANLFLREVYLDEHNKRFSIQPTFKEDVHRKIRKDEDLSEILCEKYYRKVSKNLELQFDNVIYQIKLDNPPRGLIRATVTILKKLNGMIVAKYKDKSLPIVEYAKQSHNGDVLSSKEIERFLGEKKARKLPKNHPWLAEGRAEACKRRFAA